MSARSERKYLTNREAVWREIERSQVFAWSWSKRNTIFRHTAIVLYFDEKPCFTINWRHKHGTLPVIAEGVLDIDDERQKPFHDVECKAPMEEPVLLDTEANRALAREKVELLLDFDEPYYNIFTCSCRHHVETAVTNVLKGNEKLTSDKSWIDDVLPRDVLFRIRDIMDGKTTSSFNDVIAAAIEGAEEVEKSPGSREELKKLRLTDSEVEETERHAGIVRKKNREEEFREELSDLRTEDDFLWVMGGLFVGAVATLVYQFIKGDEEAEEEDD